MTKILLVEDEPEMIMGLQDNFEIEGFEVLVARTGEEGLRRALAEAPDLIVLDVMLPGMSGLDVCRNLRRRGAGMPILMLTARGQEIDKVVGLETGADDYVTKPFGINELLARIRALLRRAARSSAELERYQFGEIELDFTKYRATRAGRPLDLSPREFEMLRYFIHHRGEAVTRDQLLNEVWGYDESPFTRTVDNHVAKLRQKIEENPEAPQYLITVHRVGYRFLG